MNPSETRRLLPALFAFLLLAACSKSDGPGEVGSAEADEPVTQEADVPVGRLGDTVVPVHYRLELKIDPTQDSFSGSVSIDANISEPVDSFWLHGKEFEVDEIFLADADGNRVAASYEQMHESGVSRV
jgi:hypothetical protein